MRTLPRWFLLVAGGFLLFSLGLLAWVADNRPFPYHFCLPLKEQFVTPGLRGIPDPGGTLSPRPPAHELRNFAFAYYSVVPETRPQLQAVAVRYWGGYGKGGGYDLSTNTVYLTPYFTVVLHEYAPRCFRA